MEDSYRIHETLTQAEKVREMTNGANWFYFVAALAVINSFAVVYSGISAFPLGLGINQFVDGRALLSGPGESLETARWFGFVINILIAAAFASFGYFARKGSDIAFVVGMFLYVADAMLILSYKDFFGFSFHLLALFFMFKGLLGSRKRYDPSV
jgi:hypothetical protein